MASAMTRETSSRTQRIALASLGPAILLAAIATPFGLPAWVLLLLAPLPWVIFVGHKWGMALAVALVAPMSLVALLVILFFSPPLGVSGFWVVLVAWAAAGLFGAYRCWPAAGSMAPPSRLSIAQWLGASVGGLGWIAVMAAAQFYPGASKLSWAMAGDSANNLLFGREVIYRGGLAYGPSADPVPLASAVSSMVMSSGRKFVSAEDLTRHDVMAFAQTWSVLIVLTCVTFGVLAGALARKVTGSVWAVAGVSAGSSLIGLTWFVTGYPIEYGFFNAHLTFAILAVSFVAFLESDRRPAVATAAIAFSATAMLAVWSPLALVPMALGAAAVVRQWRSLLATRRAELILAVVAFSQLVLYGLVVSMPAYLANSGSLAAVGGAYPFRHRMVPGLIAAAVILALVVSWRRRLVILAGTLAVCAAAAAGMLVLIASASGPANPWGYYLLKFSWFIGVVLAVLVAGLAAAAVLRLSKQPLVRLAGVGVVAAATLAFALWAPTSGSGYVAVNPAKSILAGKVFGDGDVLADRIFALSSLEDAHVLWKTGDPVAEGSINFWLLQIWSNSMSENREVRVFAYGIYDPDTINSLCDIVDAMDAHVTVHTSDATVEDQLARACPAANATVVMEPPG